MADNWLGWQVAKHLNEQNEKIVGLAIHPKEYQHYVEEIITEVKIPKKRVFVGSKNLDETFVKKVKNLEPDIILVVYWNYILPERFFSIPNLGCINFHMAYLPYNRGKNPNVWTIIEGTPAGVTMHYIDASIDSGKIIAQKTVDVYIVDTAKSVFEKQLKTFVELFKETWPSIKNGSIKSKPQNLKEGTIHYCKDFNSISEINLKEKVYPLDLINQIRAKTFEPNPSAYFIYQGKKVNISINLKYD